ncbi:MAG TPA: GDSL-type esterase/lipase family protein [Lacunisphaera sp.]|nr:GDSL-type esterase/lipase family protein [Lacunisphaera sp.]
MKFRPRFPLAPAAARVVLMGALGLFGGAFCPAPAAAPREVVNAGQGGDNTADMLARLERDVLAHAPEVVVLLAGTNDLLNSRHAVPLEQYRENLHTLAQRITATKARLILLALPPAHAPYLLQRHPAAFYGADGPGSRVTAGNAVIRELARERQVPLVDVFAAFAAAGGASDQANSLLRNTANSGKADGIHPTPAGYRLMGGLVAEVLIREDLQAARRIVCLGDSITRGAHVAGEGTATGDTYPAFLLRALNEKFPPPPAAP